MIQRCFFLITFCLSALLGTTNISAKTVYVTIIGLAGSPQYEERFAQWSTSLQQALSNDPTGMEHLVIQGESATKQRIQQELRNLAQRLGQDDLVVLTLIGHGAMDGPVYKFAIPGPDLTAAELAELLDALPAKHQIVVNTTACSGAVLPELSRPNRIVITATRSGQQCNATIFARYWIEALHNPEADVDKNERISVLEAFNFAAEKTREYYENLKRILTEVPLLDDNGDARAARNPSPASGEGRLAAMLTLSRLGQLTNLPSDPETKQLLAKKEKLEQEIERLKFQKAALPESVYRSRLTGLLVELAKTQEALDERMKSKNSKDSN